MSVRTATKFSASDRRLSAASFSAPERRRERDAHRLNDIDLFRARSRNDLFTQMARPRRMSYY